MTKRDLVLDEIEKIVVSLKTFLMTSIKPTGVFSGRTFYGDTFFLASLSILKDNPELQGKLFAQIKKKKISDENIHPEFEIYALQEYLKNNKAHPKDIKDKIHELKPKIIFLRKVSNWVLLRSLIRIRQKNNLLSVLANIQLWIILKLNRHKGYITDNTLRMWHHKNSNVSSQYHAFATMILGEIALERKSKKIEGVFLKKLEISRKEILLNGKFNMTGRGQKQIFGYASLIHSLSIAYNFTKKEKYLEDLLKIVSHLKTWQSESGKIPIVLSNKNPKKYLHSYNNFFDYSSFLLFCLLKSRNKIAK